MDIYKMLVLISASGSTTYEDKTKSVTRFKIEGPTTSIWFGSSPKVYTYKSTNVLILSNPIKFEKAGHRVTIGGQLLSVECLVLKFGDYVRVIEPNQKSTVYAATKVMFVPEKEFKRSTDIMAYFKSIAEMPSRDGIDSQMLVDQFDKMVEPDCRSALASYLSAKPIVHKPYSDLILYPFGVNASQKQAVRMALENNISVIEGPPGTGKTQTILNIIANVVASGKTVAVVAGNNSATANVQEKMGKYGFGFLTAFLGSADNKCRFFEEDQTELPKMESWKMTSEAISQQTEALTQVSNTLTSLLDDQNRVAQYREMLSKLKVEQSHFEAWFSSEYHAVSKLSFNKKWASVRLLGLYHELIALKQQERALKWTDDVKVLFKFGIYRSKTLWQNLEGYVASLMKDYYERKAGELEAEILNLERRLEGQNFAALMATLADGSLELFKGKLAQKYLRRMRETYTIKNFKPKYNDFIADYPITLSTTNSLNSCKVKDQLYDVMIIDEASQVDLVTASLALNCCKKLVIVGDDKQLPHVVTDHKRTYADEVRQKFEVSKCYDYGQHSILTSVLALYGKNVPKCLLSEHYRCHPQIIRFCNERFYNNQLVVMTEEDEQSTPLKLYRTAPGNHARWVDATEPRGWFNFRQIEVVRDEIVGAAGSKWHYSQFGIVSPYKRHVKETLDQMPSQEIMVDTIHKFQGREKDAIVFTTIVNDMDSFVDDPNMVNVAVSRAVKELCVVTSNEPHRQHGSPVADLIRYIEYHAPSCVVESKKLSIFDLLYKDAAEVLLKKMNAVKDVSIYKSERLMYALIEQVLDREAFKPFEFAMGVALGHLIKDKLLLNEEELRFGCHALAHVDFVIYSKMDKEPVLAIEVDGFKYHKNSAKQTQNDALKDAILQKSNIPLMRFATFESGEEERLVEGLNGVLGSESES